MERASRFAFSARGGGRASRARVAAWSRRKSLMTHRLGPMQTLPSPMRQFAESETVDYLIVGVGSAGGVLVQRLARAGFRVLALEAGRFWDTEKDWVSDEKGSHELYWNDLRITG